MTRRGRRITLIAVVVAIVAVATGLVLVALRDNIAFFYTPETLRQAAPNAETRIRLGGLVETGSVARLGDGAVAFVVADNVSTVKVTYAGVLPDLFREGQGIVAEGRWVDEVFVADQVLAKHDETYMPREVAEALKAQGEWRGGPLPE